MGESPNPNSTNSQVVNGTQWFTFGQLRAAIIYQLSWDGPAIESGRMGTGFLEARAERILIIRISFKTKSNRILL